MELEILITKGKEVKDLGTASRLSHNNTLFDLLLHQFIAWKIPWMEEPGRLQSMGLQRVGHD